MVVAHRGSLGIDAILFGFIPLLRGGEVLYTNSGGVFSTGARAIMHAVFYVN